MTKEFWINLPVKDLKRSIDFFSQLGFLFKPTPGNREDFASMVFGESNVPVMLFEEEEFKSFTGIGITDTSRSSEVLFSIDAESMQEVNDLAEKVKNAGGKIFAEPGEKDGWMYGCGFLDPDGHRWNILYMDTSKTPKTRNEQLYVP